MGFLRLPFYHYVIMVIGWPSIALYALLIIAIIKGRKRQAILRSSFYTMFLAQSFPCIALFLYVQFLERTRKYGFLQPFEPQQHSILVQITYVGHQLLRDAVILSFVPFAVNRFNALQNPSKYAQDRNTIIWSTRTTSLCIAAYWIVAAVIVAPLLAEPAANFSLVPNAFYSNGLSLIVGSSSLILNAYSTCIVVAVVFIVCSIFYTFAFTKLLSKKTRAAFKLKMARPDEILLLFSSYLTFSSLIFDLLDNFFTMLATYTGNKEMLNIAYDLWFVTTELMCIFPPWSLLCTSSMARRHILRLLGCTPLESGMNSRMVKNERTVGTLTITRSSHHEHI